MKCFCGGWCLLVRVLRTYQAIVDIKVNTSIDRILPFS